MKKKNRRFVEAETPRAHGAREIERFDSCGCIRVTRCNPRRGILKEEQRQRRTGAREERINQTTAGRLRQLLLRIMTL